MKGIFNVFKFIGITAALVAISVEAESVDSVDDKESITTTYIPDDNVEDLSELFVIDGHNDLPYNLYNKLENNLETFRFSENLSDDPTWGSSACASCFTDLPRLRKGQVGAQFWVAYVSCQVQYKDALGKTLEQIDVIKRLVKRYPDDMEFVTTSDGILKAVENGKIASLIGVEGGHSMDARLSALRSFYDLGVRYMTLTHSCNTPWADNSYVDDDKPMIDLTPYGEIVVKEMNRLGMMVDLSHVSHGVMNKAIEVSRAPVIFSHSSSWSVFNHNRNVHDDTLLLLKDNKGIIMVNFYSGFVHGKPREATIDHVANHINHIVDVIGHDYVGVGGDYDGVSLMPTGLEDVSKYPDLFKYLQNNNPERWTNENIKKLSSDNFLRVFKEVEKVRDELINEEPHQHWIPVEDLDAVNDDILWKCRTLTNNVSPSMIA
ncbi:dipeptidase 1-like isoform X2 [Onthophagus taurus]|uniref:dipeptidase 1-like isoform X2 n=1 Tax=Onthophagus taurus TaxID=166361 RepID=UPI000C2018F4|nr:dipeptidase 1-like isoform X2 [Onthophagus taurus]